MHSCLLTLTPKLCAVWSVVVPWALAVGLTNIRVAHSTVVARTPPTGNGQAISTCRPAHTECRLRTVYCLTKV